MYKQEWWVGAYWIFFSIKDPSLNSMFTFYLNILCSILCHHSLLNPTSKCLCLFVVKCLHWMSYVDLEYRVFVYDLNMKFESQKKEDCVKKLWNISQQNIFTKSLPHNNNNNNKEISSQVCMSTQQHVKIYIKAYKQNSNQIKYRRHKIFKCTSDIYK